MKFQKYLKNIQEYGRLYFTLEEAVKATKSTKEVISSKIYHLRKKGDVISPFRGLYIIITLKYKKLGSLEPRELIVICMEYLKIPYYVGLLTAAMYHGATHQGLFVFQVVCSKRIKKEVISGDTRLEFIYKKDISDVEVKKKVARSGYLPVSTPEETAKDVMTYYTQCGGLNHQATVLSELTEAINTKKLVSLAKRSGKFFWVQRMGYILDNIDTFYEKDRDRVVVALEKFLADNDIIPINEEGYIGVKIGKKVLNENKKRNTDSDSVPDPGYRSAGRHDRWLDDGFARNVSGTHTVLRGMVVWLSLARFWFHRAGQTRQSVRSP